jgi:hypothetical protein
MQGQAESPGHAQVMVGLGARQRVGQEARRRPGDPGRVEPFAQASKGRDQGVPSGSAPTARAAMRGWRRARVVRSYCGRWQSRLSPSGQGFTPALSRRRAQERPDLDRPNHRGIDRDVGQAAWVCETAPSSSAVGTNPVSRICKVVASGRLAGKWKKCGRGLRPEPRNSSALARWRERNVMCASSHWTTTARSTRTGPVSVHMARSGKVIVTCLPWPRVTVTCLLGREHPGR